MQPVEDEIGRWADENRMYITPELEQKLRAASYFPWDDPDTIPADVWQNRHNIGHYELMRMQELYAMYVDITIPSTELQAEPMLDDQNMNRRILSGIG